MTFATKENAQEALQIVLNALDQSSEPEIPVAEEELEFLADFLSAAVNRLPCAATCEKHNGKNRKRKPRAAKARREEE